MHEFGIGAAKNLNRNRTESMDERSDVISINSGMLPGSHGSIHSAHRSTPTQLLFDSVPVHSLKETSSALSGMLSTASNDAYYDNLKLRNVERKVVDKQRPKDLLNNLPSGRIIDGAPAPDLVSSEDEDDSVLYSGRLHDEANCLTIV